MKEYATVVVVYTEWEVTGGEGVFEHYNNGKIVRTELSPGTTARVVTTGVPEFGANGTATYIFDSGMGIAPDYGQADLPASVMKDWSQRGEYAKDASGTGTPMSARFNPSSIQSGVPRDGTAQIDQNFNLVGNYNW